MKFEEEVIINHIIRIILITFGTIFLLLGISALVVPLVPTMPFLILAAACYAKSSQRFLHWLLNMKWFGPHLRNYYEGRGLPLYMKMFFILFFTAAMGISALFFAKLVWIRVLMAVIAIAVTIYVFTIKTFEEEKK